MNEVHFLGNFSTKCRRLKGEMIMASEKDIENLMKMLDGKVEVHHHGRCDVGSAWAKGTVKNPECIDIPTEIEPED